MSNANDEVKQEQEVEVKNTEEIIALKYTCDLDKVNYFEEVANIEWVRKSAYDELKKQLELTLDEHSKLITKTIQRNNNDKMKIERLQRRGDDYKKMNDELQSKYDELEKKYNDEKSRRIKVTNEYDHHYEEYKKLSDNYDELEKKYKEESETTSSLIRQLQDSVHTEIHLKNEIVDLQSNYEELKREDFDVSALTELESRYDELEKKYEQEKTWRKGLQIEGHKQKQQLNELKSKHDSLKREIKDLYHDLCVNGHVFHRTEQQMFKELFGSEVEEE